MKNWLLLCSGTALLLTACAAPVTVTPYPTQAPYPTFTPYPAEPQPPTLTPYPTPVSPLRDLANLFCEFEFCIGHPADVYLTDYHPLAMTSQTTFGAVYGIGETMVFVNWSPMLNPAWDPARELADGLAQMQVQVTSQVEQEDLNGFTVYYAQGSGAHLTRNYALGGIWACGSRLFRVLYLSPRPDIMVGYLRDAVGHFTCQP